MKEILENYLYIILISKIRDINYQNYYRNNLIVCNYQNLKFFMEILRKFVELQILET